MDCNRGLISDISFIPSPNHNQRPSGTKVDLLVIHNISLPPGEFGGDGISQCFTNQLNANEHPYYAEIIDLRVSAHALIRRDGTVMQYVPFHRRAWHAGISSFQGRENCNDFSIGIELEGNDALPYEFIQYQQLIILTKALLSVYPCIALNRIVGHSDIAPGRKTDPGSSFDWPRYRQGITGD
ncbi:MAG: 1,6-anhydro-N-acetylmuramyl-L-alanine amidase AmpD [Gammaproteobacteria bacterium]|nr:1,6-anhydro-N-acetylmuramyl-L-alanine amidase AmpD [Gammaproteobacteria bacterium]